MATLYKVQSGAYKSAAGAAASALLARKKIEKYLKKIKSTEKVGVAVINSGGYYKVQEGAFESKENAIRRRDLVRDAGVYAVVIETKTQDTMPAAPAKTETPAADEMISPRIRVWPIWFFEGNESLYGDCTAILEYDSDGKTVKHCILIDCARGKASDTIIRKLKAAGITKIDAVFISHGHGDHYGGLSNILKAFPVGALYLPDPTELDKHQKSYGNALRNQAKKVKNHLFLKAGDVVNIGSIKCDCLFICPAWKLPEHDTHYFVNNESMVLRFVLGGKWIFFTAGDLQNEGNKVLLTAVKAGLLKAHILKLQWHGDGNACLAALLEVIRPLVAFSNYHHKESKGGRQVTRKKAEAVGALVARNWENGDIYIDCQGDEMKVSCSKKNLSKTFKL